MKSLKDTLAKRREMSLTDKEALAEKIHTPEEKPLEPSLEKSIEASPTKSVHRLTLDLPTWLVDKIKEETERNGQTIKGYILTTLLRNFGK